MSNAEEEDLPVAYMGSDEQIFTPFCTYKDKQKAKDERKSDEPSFLPPTKKEGNESSLFDNGHVSPTSNDLDPFFKPEKHDFSIAITNSDKEINLQILQAGEDDEEDETEKENAEEVEEIRSVCLRTPLILSGWSYGLDGKPQPFDISNARKFREDFAINRNLWKTGPLDVRWDEERKVFAPFMDIIEGYLKTPMLPGGRTNPTTFELEVFRCRDTDIEENGVENHIKEWKNVNEVLKGVNRSSVSASEGTYVMVVRINYEYRPIWVDC